MALPPPSDLPPALPDDKYIVVKVGDVVWHEDGDIGRFHLSHVLADATVIRGQEIFAATALFSYANSILATIELLEALDIPPPKSLMDIADHFHNRGMDARAIGKRKIPD